MKKLCKRISAAVLALTVLLTALVFDVPGKIAAKAAQSSSAGGCNGDHSGMTKLTSSTVLPSKSSGDYYYYLDEDITLDTLLDIDPPPNGFSYDINVTLCLNGHTLTAASKMRILYICSATFTLCDCEGSGHPGKMTGGNTTGISGGGAVYVGNSTGKKGGTFIMNGGTITGNNTTRTGGGVMVNDRTSTFIMNGGTISNNNAAGNGGGVYTDCGTIIINGGTISGNTSSMGGGIYCYDSTLNGGTITGNKADTGGGIYFSGEVTLNGNVTITGNTKTDGTTSNNLYMDSGNTLTIENGFSNSSKIGVTTVNSPADCTGYVEVTGTTSKDVSSCFTADNDKLSIVYKNGKVQLTGAHSYGTTWGKDANNHWHTCSNCGGKDSAAHTWNSGEVTAATCTAPGVKKFTCTACGQIKNETIPATNHSFSNDWETDDTNHWHACTRTNCTAVSGEAKHSFNQKKNGDNHWDECSVCGYKKNITAHDYTASKRDENDHWQECGCGAKKDITEHNFEDKSDDTCFWQECSCGYIIGKTEHSHFTQKYDDDNHWYECDVCQHKKNIEKHPFAQQHDGNNHWQECDCGYKKDEAKHEWGAWTLTDKPSVNEPGTAERSCSCGEKQTKTDVPKLTDPVWSKTETEKPTVDTNGEYAYESDYGTVTVDVPKLTDPVWTKTETEKPTVDTNGEYTYESDYGTVTVDVPKLNDETVWTKDAENSIPPTENYPGKDVYTSDYGEVEVRIPELAHTHELTYVPEVPATETKEGTKEHWHCGGCDKDFADKDGEVEMTESDLIIPVIKAEITVGENAPQVTTDQDKLIEAVDIGDVEDSSEIKITLIVEDASETVDEQDKLAAEEALTELDGFQMGQFIDISLIMETITGSETTTTAITETKKPLTITLAIPSGLLGKAEYSVIRVHEGEITVLEDMDDDPATVTIQTDKFSTYALAYTEKASDDTPPDESSSDSEATPSGSGGTSDSDTALPGNDNSSNNESGGNSDNSDTSGDDNNYKPSENTPTNNNHGNPSTGVAVSLLPLAAAITVLTVTAKRKKK